MDMNEEDLKNSKFKTNSADAIFAARNHATP
jgi:hypothetical protein